MWINIPLLSIELIFRRTTSATRLRNPATASRKRAISFENRRKLLGSFAGDDPLERLLFMRPHRVSRRNAVPALIRGMRRALRMTSKRACQRLSADLLTRAIGRSKKAIATMP